MKNKDFVWFVLLIIFWILVAVMLIFLPGCGRIPNEPESRGQYRADPENKQYELAAELQLRKQVECLALNVYHEARDQGRVGMLLVGHVTINRVESDRYPDNICDVVFQPYQFSWTHQRMDFTPHETKMWHKSWDVALDIINRDFDRSKGALFYYNPSLANPKWAKSMQVVVTEKDHVFLVNNN